jgi:hypothetical protein
MASLCKFVHMPYTHACRYPSPSWWSNAQVFQLANTTTAAAAATVPAVEAFVGDDGQRIELPALQAPAGEWNV